MPTPATAAAIWSAVAASFAALSSFLIMWIQRRSLLESVRPELVLTGWSRSQRGEGDTAHEVIAFQAIKNVGRGAALHIIINSKHIVDNRPAAILGTIRLPILASNETAYIRGEIIVWWQNVKPDQQGLKVLPITIQISAWDSRNMRHDTEYSFMAIELAQNVGIIDEIAPGVGMGTRTTITKSFWSLKLRARLARIPGLRRLLAKKT